MVRLAATCHSLGPKGLHMELGQHIKENRTRMGLSQERLAQEIYVSRVTISNWENDRTYPDVQSLLLLSNLFEVSVDALIKGDVQEMKAILAEEATRMNRLAAVMAGCGGATLLWVFVTALLDLEWPVILIPTVALFIPAAGAAGMVEKIKHDNQLFTYRAVEAFMRGENPGTLDEKNQRAGSTWWAKLAVKTVLAIAVGFCADWGLLGIVKHLLG